MSWVNYQKVTEVKNENMVFIGKFQSNFKTTLQQYVGMRYVLTLPICVRLGMKSLFP